MSLRSKSIEKIKEFAITYPAVLSGYIIYGYLFITIMRFFLKAKTRELSVYEIYEVFDALPFLWLLSSALVKIIEIRTALHNAEKEKILQRQELKIKQMQLNTMREVAKGFQHRINNPLSITSIAVSRVKRIAADRQEILDPILAIEEATVRITQALVDFSEAQRYEAEYIGPVLGSMASPPSLKPVV